MRVLVTGHRGYVGSVLTSVLRHARFEVVGLDCDLYNGCDFGRVGEAVPRFDADLKDIACADLLSFDAVVHLAELPDDNSGLLDPVRIGEINHETTMRLAESCRASGVSRFLYASSCSVYGRGDHEPLNESSPVRPHTTYAASKLRCERALARLADDSFTPVFLRNASVYGVSPRLRLDLLVNDLVASAVATGCVILKSIGSAWQPLVHVEDVARVCAAVLLAPDGDVRNEVFNVVGRGENHRAIDIANAVTELLPDCRQSVARDTFDTHSLRVDGSKLEHTFPKLLFRWTLQRGIRQLYSAMARAGLTPAQWRSSLYRRVLRLARRMQDGPITGSPCFDHYRTAAGVAGNAACVSA